MAGSNAVGSFGPFVDRTWSSSLYSDRLERVDRSSLAPMPATTSVSSWRSPSHPAHPSRQCPWLHIIILHQLLPSGTIAVRQDKIRRVRSDDSRLCWIDPIRGSVPPGDRTACKTVGRTVFSNVRPVFEVPVVVFRPIASFPEMGRNEHHAHHT